MLSFIFYFRQPQWKSNASYTENSALVVAYNSLMSLGKGEVVLFLIGSK